jgi:TrmH family RNA methyltransferase
MPVTINLHNLSIVLVDTKSPANIGSTARCMMNMGLSRLVLVQPPEDPVQSAAKLAAGADAILAQAELFPTLREAVADCALVFGTSRHKGRLRKNIRTPHDIAEEIIPLLSKNKIALVFGNEVNGLTRDDLALCNEIITIPSSDSFPSLNLSHAVMIMAYELFLASKTHLTPDVKEFAASGMVEDFYLHLEQTLLEIDFLDKGETDRMMFTLRQLFGRARMGPRDVAVLRGILTAVERAAGAKRNRQA